MGGEVTHHDMEVGEQRRNEGALTGCDDAMDNINCIGGHLPG